MDDDVARPEAVLVAFQVRLPDEVDDIDMVERAHDCLKEGLALLFGLAQWQLRDAVARHPISPRLVNARACSRSWCPSLMTAFRCRALRPPCRRVSRMSFNMSRLFDKNPVSDFMRCGAEDGVG